MDHSRSKCLETYLPYELSEIPEQLRCRAKTELFEDEDTRIHSLKLLRSMLKDEPDLHWQDDDLFLLSFLRARKFDVKRAFQLMKNFYTQIDKHKELYSNFNFQDVKKVLEKDTLGFLPYRDSDGCIVLFVRMNRWDPPEDTLGDVMRVLTCALLHANLSPATQIVGFKVVTDNTGFSLKHVPHISPSYVLLMAQSLHNCFPARLQGSFVINENPMLTSFWKIFKSVLTKKIKERIHFFGKDVKKVHKYISPSILPADVQGELPTYDNTEWRQSVEEKADYFTHVFSHGYRRNRSKSQDKK